MKILISVFYDFYKDLNVDNSNDTDDATTDFPNVDDLENKENLGVMFSKNILFTLAKKIRL